jgi:hypothetical protein
MRLKHNVSAAWHVTALCLPQIFTPFLKPSYDASTAVKAPVGEAKGHRVQGAYLSVPSDMTFQITHKMLPNGFFFYPLVAWG